MLNGLLLLLVLATPTSDFVVDQFCGGNDTLPLALQAEQLLVPIQGGSDFHFDAPNYELQGVPPDYRGVKEPPAVLLRTVVEGLCEDGDHDSFELCGGSCCEHLQDEAHHRTVIVEDDH